MIYTLWFHNGITPEEPWHRRTVSWIIKTATRGPFSHSELQRGLGGPCFSADGYINQVRWKQIGFSHPDRWTGIRFPTTSIEDRAIMRRCESIEGAAYDYVGAVLLPFRGPHHPDKWWCSEADSHVLGWKPSNVSPTALYLRGLERYGNSAIVKPHQF